MGDLKFADLGDLYNVFGVIYVRGIIDGGIRRVEMKVASPIVPITVSRSMTQNLR